MVQIDLGEVTEYVVPQDNIPALSGKFLRVVVSASGLPMFNITALDFRIGRWVVWLTTGEVKTL